MTNHLRTATLVVILFAPLLTYLPTLRYQFVFDDPDQIVNNAAVHSPSSIPRYLPSDVSAHASADEVGNFCRPVFRLWLLAKTIRSVNSIPSGGTLRRWACICWRRCWFICSRSG